MLEATFSAPPARQAIRGANLSTQTSLPVDSEDTKVHYDFCLIKLNRTWPRVSPALWNPRQIQPFPVWWGHIMFIMSFFPSPSQFYRCFLVLFHCNHWSAENGNISVPSRTTVIQLNRRVYSNTVACAAQISTAQISTDAFNHCCSTSATKQTTPPPGVMTCPWIFSMYWRVNSLQCWLRWTVDSDMMHLDSKCTLGELVLYNTDLLCSPSLSYCAHNFFKSFLWNWQSICFHYYLLSTFLNPIQTV